MTPVPVLPREVAALLCWVAISAPPLGTAHAAPSNIVAVAVRASEVHDAACSTVASGAADQHAQAVGAVGLMLAEVSELYNSTKDPSLLYWRGLLNQCMAQDSRAHEDLQAFVARADEEPGLSDLRRDAQRRLRRLDRLARQGQRSAPNPGPIGVGIALFGVAGALGAGSAAQAQDALNAQDSYYQGLRPYDESLALIEAGTTSAEAARGLVVGAAIAAVAGAVSLGLSSLPTPDTGRTAAWIVLPTPQGGAVLALAGTW